MRSRTMWYLMVVAVLVGITGCGGLTQAKEEPRLAFELGMEVNSDQEFHISAGVRNVGDATFGGDESFHGEMEIRHMPSGDLRARAEVVPLPSIAPGETAWPLSWHGQLAAGTYELTWGAAEYGSTSEEFSIVEKDGRLYFRGEPLASPSAEGSSGGDREALVALAVSDLQRRLEVRANEVDVKSVEPTEFSDASLGVPEPGQSYAQVIVPGYVIQLEVGDEVFEYHAAEQRVVLVPAAAEEGAPDESNRAYETATVEEVGLTFEVPTAWEQIPGEFVWTLAEGSDQRLGFDWMELQPPMEPEAAMLPEHAQIIDSAPVELGWAEGRRFTLEVYAPATESDDAQAPVESVQMHVLIVLTRDGSRLGLHFYASAPGGQGLREMEPVLEHVVDTARLADDA